MTYRKKLIEVALPLEAINIASAREKSIRHGHPSTLHLWWARRPLAACRAVLFAQLVDDPSANPDLFPTGEAQQAERERLFRVIERLVLWENSTNEDVLNDARREIARSVARAAGVAAPESPDEVRRVLAAHAPPVLDPFCGGSIPLEAQRLGLEAHGSDLNPVAVLITKALIEIPPKFADRPPVNPQARADARGNSGWKGAAGLAADVRYYGKWMRDEAQKRIGHLYPKVQLPREHGGGAATVIAWLWARTVTCPNPACRATMPLVRSFWLSTKAGKKAWVAPVVDHAQKTVRFEVCSGQGVAPDGTVSRNGATCLCCGAPVPLDHVRAEGRAERMGARMMAIVADGPHGRIYLPPTPEQEAVAAQARPEWAPETDLPEQALSFRVQLYGMTKHRDLFTLRQLAALSTLSDLVGEARARAQRDAIAMGMYDDGILLNSCGTGATAYADAMATYLSLGVSKLADASTSLTRWKPSMDQAIATFARQAIPMVWDYAESNVFNGAAGDYLTTIGNIVRAIVNLPASKIGFSQQLDATNSVNGASRSVISTDPPYYDNIGYADLSDFFYVWLRHSLGRIYPDLFSTLLTPKAQELIATPYRFDGSKAKAEQFFEQGSNKAFTLMRAAQHHDFPLTVYYAFKQAESESSTATIASTGWETMLEGLLRAGFAITGTWPMRTELSNRSIASGTNALASSIVLVCRPRPEDAPITSRRDFLRALARQLPDELRILTSGRVAPVDLAQAAIGPGMAIFTRYAKVMEADGKPMSVRTALGIINEQIEEFFTKEEGSFDPDSSFCLSWYQQYGAGEGRFGEAEVLARAKNVVISTLERRGVLKADKGNMRLLRPSEYPDDWNPTTATHVTAWEATAYLVAALKAHGEPHAAGLAARLGGVAEDAKKLAYRLYDIASRNGWTAEALDYNNLVAAWTGIQKSAAGQGGYVQQRLLGEE